MKVFSNLPIGVKLPAIMTMLVGFTIIVMTIANFLLMEMVTKTRAAEKLQNAAESTVSRLETWFYSIDRI